ncbi:ABC transporter ATP-binding protein [Chlorobium sp. N1]|uniref:ABC transporter ATP-binding protein n=1 Tax=Chlorobium sp. N1 TaxID=2491138 RepID=UPI00103CFBD9|nr:ABC transporter ATP-binding protein [Chlorobium sp. N1]TCD48954.1 ABC transporter ATP-binding protein [Chlorobium sp. N1]
MKIKIINREKIHRILAMLSGKERRMSLVILAMMLFSVVLETLGVGMVIPALALFTEKDIATKYPLLQPVFEFFGNPDQITVVIGGLGVLFLIYSVKASFMLLMLWQQNRFLFSIGERLSKKLFSIYLQQPYTFHLQHNSAQLIRNVTSEVEVFANNVLKPIMELTIESLTILCIFTLLVLVEPFGTLNIILTLGSASLLYVLLTKGRVARWGSARMFHDGLRMQHLQQGLGGIKDVKILGKENYFLEQYGYHNSAGARVRKLNTTVQQMPRLWLELLAVAGLIVLVLSMLSQGLSIEAIIPNLGFFAVASFRMIPSVNRILMALQALQYCLPVIDIIGNDFSLPNPQRKEAGNTVEFRHDLRAESISFTYPQATRQTLHQIRLTITKGESVGFIGPSGSGKSTLIDIILGLIIPDSGSITVDGRNTADDLRSWQNMIGYVPQSIYLTDNDLAHNIAFGLPDEEIEMEKVKKAVRAANLETFVNELPEGLSTFVGERGVRLSGGQRQRIGIARALYHDPEILVLDEATSALDTLSETAVMDAIKALQGTKTVMIVAHRLTTVEHCDRIYRLEQGTIAAEGSPAMMLQESAP